MKKLMCLAVAVGSLMIAGCSEGPKKNGSACETNTVCEGLCLLGMPDGLCTSVCFGDIIPCGSNEVCTWIVGDNYCLQSCVEDSSCRDGYVCLSGACRPPAEAGVECVKDTDCTSGLCSDGLCSGDCTTHADCPGAMYCDDPGDGSLACLRDDCSSGICQRPCAGHDDCAEGTYCLESDSGDLLCALVPDDDGPGTLGHSCAAQSCASGYDCVERFDGDMQAYCTKDCSSTAECGPGMICQGSTGNQRCLKRSFCNTCAFDGQCGFSTEKCVSADTAVSPGEAYCSTNCDPDDAQNPGCPPDSECLEASFCTDTNTWVADCAECSGTCGPMGAATYQCFHTAGSCSSGGGGCTPCADAGDCTSGVCVDVIGISLFNESNRICTEPCVNDVCPVGFFCLPVDGQPDQCFPRSGECSEPSDGGTQCDYCDMFNSAGYNPFKGCDTGICAEDGSVERCFDGCDPGMPDCAAYTNCEIDTLSLYQSGTGLMICVPTLPCSQWQQCITHCPTGPASCDGTAPAYCL